MSAPTSIREVLDQITAKQHEYRVVEHLVECLRPFVDMDTGRRRTLEPEGCLVPFVPQDIIISKVRWLAKEMNALQDAIDGLQSAQIMPPAPALPALTEAVPAPAVVAAAHTTKPRATKVKPPAPAPQAPEPAPKKGKKRNEDPVRPAAIAGPVGPEPRKRRARTPAA